MNPTTANREAARRPDGKFGEQHHNRPPLDNDNHPHTYSTLDELTTHEILPILGDYTDDYNLDGITSDLINMGWITQNNQGFQSASPDPLDTDRLNTILVLNDTTNPDGEDLTDDAGYPVTTEEWKTLHHHIPTDEAVYTQLGNNQAIRISNDGTTIWTQNGQPHRDSGPAITNQHGDQAWYQHGELHREDGPAIIGANGYQAWYQHGEPHRDLGPAITKPANATTPPPCTQCHRLIFTGYDRPTPLGHDRVCALCHDQTPAHARTQDTLEQPYMTTKTPHTALGLPDTTRILSTLLGRCGLWVEGGLLLLGLVDPGVAGDAWGGWLALAESFGVRRPGTG